VKFVEPSPFNDPDTAAPRSEVKFVASVSRDALANDNQKAAGCECPYPRRSGKDIRAETYDDAPVVSRVLGFDRRDTSRMARKCFPR
jgi:hypothetical protein